MARTDDLTNFLNDVSAAIKSKLDDNTPIPAGQFDTKIMEIETVGNYQDKTVNITQNGTQTITPDTSYDAIEQLTLNVSVPIASLQSKSYEFTTNQTMTLLPDTGYDGFSSVNIAVNTTDPEYATNLALSQQILGGSALPYIPLEYIESNGTEYIDTNYSPKTNTDFEILTELIEDNGTDKVVFGSRIDNERFWLDFDGSGSISKFIILGYGDYTKPALYEVGKKYNIKFNSTTKKMTINNNSYDINTTFNATNSLPIYIFRANYTSTFPGKFKLYKLKFFESGNLVHYYIPVKRKSDNEVCLYDKVTNQFFTNQGTGSFIAGPEI